MSFTFGSGITLEQGFYLPTDFVRPVPPTTFSLSGSDTGWYDYSTSWYSASPYWKFEINLGSAPNSSFLTKLNALQIGSTVTLTDQQHIAAGSVSFTIVSLGSRPSGGWGAWSQILLSTNVHTPANDSWYSITSITI